MVILTVAFSSRLILGALVNTGAWFAGGGGGGGGGGGHSHHCDGSACEQTFRCHF